MKLHSFVISLFLTAATAQATQLESQPLRYMKLTETKLTVSKNIKDLCTTTDCTEITLQNGSAVADKNSLDKNLPFCTLKTLDGRTITAAFLDQDVTGKISYTEGNYGVSSVFKQAAFHTHLQTTANLSINCENPSAMKFNEITIGEFQKASAPTLILTDVDAEIPTTPPFDNSFPLDPSLISLPNSEVGVALNTDLSISGGVVLIQNGRTYDLKDRQYDLTQKYCALSVKSLKADLEVLKKGTFLKAKSVSMSYSKDEHIASLGGVQIAATSFELTNANGEVNYLLLCTNRSLNIVSYKDIVAIFGSTMGWSIRDLE